MRADFDEGVTVSETASISASIAERYAQALFEISKESQDLARLEADADALAEALDVSSDLRAVLSSPRVSREEMSGVVAALAEPLGLSKTTANTLALMADKRRLFVLPSVVKGTGIFPHARQQVVEGDCHYPLEDIQAGTAIPDGCSFP